MTQTILLAHLREHAHVYLTVALSPKTRILFAFVHDATGQVRQPSLDRACRNESENAFRTRRQANTLPFAFRLQRGNARVNTDSVAVDQHNQDARHNCLAESRHFLREALPHKLLTSAAAALCLLDTNVAWPASCSGQEAAGESFVLVVFAENDNPGSATHSSQPLAMASESFSGPVNWCCGAPTATAPYASRHIRRPLSPPK